MNTLQPVIVLEFLTCDKVTTHEHLLQLIIVLIFPKPDRIILRVKLLPEVGNRFSFILIGITAFEVIQVESAVGRRD
jgi:hypothetical protein